MSTSTIELVGGPRDGKILDWAIDRETFEFVILPEERLRIRQIDEDYWTRRDVRKGIYADTDRRRPCGRRIFQWAG